MKKFERKTVYIYEINGKEKIKVTSAEEALHWDSIFEVAEQVDQLLRDSPPELHLNEAQRSELSLYLAQNRTELCAVLSGGELAVESEDKLTANKAAKATKTTEDNEQQEPVKKQKFVQEFKRPVEPSKDGFGL